MRSPLIIGTRGSDLAMWQANYVKSLLQDAGIESELLIIQTKGDAIQHLSLEKIEGKGFFTKEIEDALLNNVTDIAVHSYKDLPTEITPGLIVGAIPEREDPAELLIINKNAVDLKRKFGLKSGAKTGTSSSRRKSQLMAFRSDIVFDDIRGNVPTRVEKLRAGNYDAILLAYAGVERLGLDLTAFHVEKIDSSEFIPAPAQGALAIQVRESDIELRKILSSIDVAAVRVTTDIEKKVLQLFHGGCQTPVGVTASYDDETEMYCARASHALRWNDYPVSVYSESKNPQQLAERIVDKINGVKPCRVFISRNGRRDNYLRNVLTGKGFSLIEKAMIEMIPVPYMLRKSFDWIFFSSKHAVKYFFEQNPPLASEKIACVGKATADAVRRYGKRAEFIGSSTDTKMTGKKFGALIGNAKVLFPQAKGSLRTIQQQLVKQDNITDLSVYETIKMNDGEMPEADILVFTSPSNAEAWLEKFPVNREQKIVAMGDATANPLRQHRITVSALPDTFDDTGIARAVFGVSSNII